MLGKNHILCSIAALPIIAAASSATYSVAHSLTEHFKPDLTPKVELVANHLTDLFYIQPNTFTSPWLGWLTLIAAGFFFILGALLPDIDSKSSILGRHFQLPIPHRVLHNAWFLFPFFLIAPLHSVFAYLFLGILLHLLLDAPSKAGIIWFYPLTNGRSIKIEDETIITKPYHRGLYKVGHASEYVFVTIILVLSILSTLLLYLQLTTFTLFT